MAATVTKTAHNSLYSGRIGTEVEIYKPIWQNAFYYIPDESYDL